MTRSSAVEAARYTGTYPGRPDQVRRARTDVSRHLAADDAVLITSELASNAILFFLLCFRVAIAAVGGKRTCGLCCSTTSSSLPLVAEPRETGQPATGQGQLRHEYHRTRRVRREVLHSHSKDRSFTLRAEIFPGYLWLEVEDLGGPWHLKPRDTGRPHGLDVVEALTGPDNWGIDGDQAGRVVWCRLHHR